MNKVAEKDVVLLTEGMICEFEDCHGRPVLGFVQSAKPSGQKGAVYQIVDAEEYVHTVPAKAISITFPPDTKSKATKPSEILKHFIAITECKPTELGVDVGLLDLAWEMCAEEDVPSHTSGAIFEEIDEKLVQGSLQRYKAYRLLASDIGHIFFKVLHAHDHEHREYKAKTADSVAKSKELWCKAVEALGEMGASSEEFCFA
jgi:hypothetical protein